MSGRLVRSHYRAALVDHPLPQQPRQDDFAERRTYRLRDAVYCYRSSGLTLLPYYVSWF